MQLHEDDGQDDAEWPEGDAHAKETIADLEDVYEQQICDVLFRGGEPRLEWVRLLANDSPSWQDRAAAAPFN